MKNSCKKVICKKASEYEEALHISCYTAIGANSTLNLLVINEHEGGLIQHLSPKTNSPKDHQSVNYSTQLIDILDPLILAAFGNITFNEHCLNFQGEVEYKI